MIDTTYCSASNFFGTVIVYNVIEMKRIIVILASLLFTAVALFGNPVKRHDIPSSRQVVAKEKLAYKLMVKVEHLVITFDEVPAENLIIEVFNLTGKRVERFMINISESSSNRHELSFEEVHPNGLYIIKVSSSSQSRTKKFQM